MEREGTGGHQDIQLTGVTDSNPNTVLSSEEVKHMQHVKVPMYIPTSSHFIRIINNKDVNLCKLSDHLARSQDGTIVEKMSSGWDSLLVLAMSIFGATAAFDIQASILLLVALSHRLLSFPSFFVLLIAVSVAAPDAADGCGDRDVSEVIERLLCLGEATLGVSAGNSCPSDAGNKLIAECEKFLPPKISTKDSPSLSPMSDRKVSREPKRPLGSERPRMEPTTFPFPSRCPAILANPECR